MRKRTSHAHRQRAFTLVEVSIGVAILALVVAVLVPAANNVSRADLRKSASALSATIKQTYDLAALSGETYRLLMVPTKGEVKVESTVDVMSINGDNGQVDAVDDELSASLWGDPNADFSGTGSIADKDRDKGKDAAPDPGAGGMLSMLTGAATRGQRAAKAGFSPKGKVKLDGDVTIMDVWTDGLSAVIAEGDCYLYFFPGGYTQDAYIHLQDGDKRVYTLKVNPLTGRVTILDSYVEAPVGR